MIEITLPFPVSVNALFFNRRKGAVGRNGNKLPGRGKTREYEGWLHDAGWEINIQKPRPIKGPVAIEYAIGIGRKADIDNIPKAISDLLVRHRLIDGDGPEVVRKIQCEFQSELVGVRVRVKPIETPGA